MNESRVEVAPGEVSRGALTGAPMLSTLYSDPSTVPTSKLGGVEADRLRTLVKWIQQTKDKLTNNSDQYPDPGAAWFDFAREFLLHVICNVLHDYGFDPTSTHETDFYQILHHDFQFQFYLCGSLAKKQATPYSDLDGFVIWKDPEDYPRDHPDDLRAYNIRKLGIARLKEALKGMYHLFLRIFEETGQFCPDPLGITPFKYHGTPEELYQVLAKEEDELKNLNEEMAKVSCFINSITNARPLLCDPVLLEELAAKVSSNEKLKEEYSSYKLYQKVVDTYKGPQTTNKIHLKNDVFRPLDFFMMALRNDYGVRLENGNHLATPETINQLIAQGKMSYEFGDFILSIYYDALKLRFECHNAAGQEKDNIDINESNKNTAEKLIHKIAIVRGIASERLAVLNKGLNLSESRLSLSGLDDVPYQSAVHSKPEKMLHLVAPYLYADPGREYFEQKYPVIQSNLAAYDPEKPGEIEKIFSEITEIPTHLQYLSEALTDCIENARSEEGDETESSVKIVLNREKFREWSEIFLQNAISDLFNGETDLHPWVKRAFSTSRRNKLNFDEETYKKLLIGYLSNIIGNAMHQNIVVGMIEDETQKAEVYHLAEEVRRELGEEILNTPLEELVQKHSLFRGQLGNFNEAVQHAIKVLTEVKASTRDTKFIQKIEARIKSYETLGRDLETVKTNNDNTILHQGFLHKAYHFFSRDLKEFEAEVKRYEPGLFTFIKEKLVAVWDFLSTGRTKILTKAERIEKLDKIVIDTDDTYQKSVTEGARPRKRQREEGYPSFFESEVREPKRQQPMSTSSRSEQEKQDLEVTPLLSTPHS